MLVLGLVGCTNNPENNLSTENNNFLTENEDVVITFVYDDHYQLFIEPLMEAFHEENPSITVVFIPLSETGYNSAESIGGRLMALASAADTSVTGIRVPELGNYFLDLQPLIDADSSFDPADFWTGSLSGLADAQGRILGLPMKYFLRGIFYDKAAFDEANLSYPQPGWTWDDFRRMSAALTQTEGSDIRYGYADRSSLSILEPLIGQELALNDGQIEAEILADELDWYVPMAQEEQILGVRRTDDYWNAILDFGVSPAMWYGNLFELTMGLVTGEPEATDLKSFFEDSTYGYAPFPVDADGENIQTTPVNVQAGVISAGSEHPVEAWKWLTYLSEHWLIADTSFASNQLHIPARRSVAEAVAYWELFPDNVQIAMQYGLDHAWFVGMNTQAEEAVLRAVEKAVSGSEDLLSALQGAETEQASWPQEDQTPPKIVVDPPPSELQAGVPKIKMYYRAWTAPEEAAIKSSIDYFNQLHEGEFVVEATGMYPQSEGMGYYELMGSNFDCYLSQLDAEGAAYSDVVLDLTALMEGEELDFQQDFDPAILDSARHQERLMALPLASLPAVVVYNADLLEQNGLEPPPLDWTFDDFLTYLTTVTSTAGPEKIYGFITSSNSVATTDMFYAWRGVQWKDVSGAVPAVHFDTPEMADLLIWLNELDQSGVFYRGEAGSEWWGSLVATVDAGQVGFWTANAGDEGSEFINGRLSYETGIAPLPAVDKPNGPLGRIDSLGFYISNSTENVETCWALGKYLSGQADVVNGIPARTSLLESQEWINRIGADKVAVYQKSIENSLADITEDPYSYYLWSPIMGWLAQARLDLSNQDPSQVLAEFQQMSDLYLDCMADYDLLNMNWDAYRNASESCEAQVDPDSPN
jgi:ABC-type glycerol-3-phosphate transport system substrate-binding protein